MFLIGIDIFIHVPIPSSQNRHELSGQSNKIFETLFNT